MAALKHHAWLLFALCLLFGSALGAAPKETDFSKADVDAGKALTSLNQLASTNTDAITPKKMRRQTSKCSKSNLKIRREW